MLSSSHKKFADGIAAGLSGTQAYRAAFPRCTSQHAAEVSASRLLRSAEVIAEVERIRHEAEKLAGGAVLTLAEKRRFLARLVRANIAELPATSDLWHEIHTTSEGGVKRKLGCKLRAIALDNDLASDGSEAAANDAAVDVVAMLAQLMGVRE